MHEFRRSFRKWRSSSTTPCAPPDVIGSSRIVHRAHDSPPRVAQAIAFVREGDVLVTWKLDRLARSLPHLIKGLTVREAASRLKIGKTALYDALAQKTRLPKEDKA